MDIVWIGGCNHVSPAHEKIKPEFKVITINYFSKTRYNRNSEQLHFQYRHFAYCLVIIRKMVHCSRNVDIRK
jgi:hypothetical protein